MGLARHASAASKSHPEPSSHFNTHWTAGIEHPIPNLHLIQIAKFRRSNLGLKFALKMGPKFALTDIFQNNMGRGYLPMNPKKSEVCPLGYVPSPKFLSVWSYWFWIFWWSNWTQVGYVNHCIYQGAGRVLGCTFRILRVSLILDGTCNGKKKKSKMAFRGGLPGVTNTLASGPFGCHLFGHIYDSGSGHFFGGG